MGRAHPLASRKMAEATFGCRPGPTDELAATKLKKRTLTNLYNERPAWLEMVHRNLDEAVFAAYGWDPDMTDEDILENLLALNLKRSEAAQ